MNLKKNGQFLKMPKNIFSQIMLLKLKIDFIV